VSLTLKHIMGQYYLCIFLAEDGKYIRAFVSPHNYNNGAKLVEHSYNGNPFMDAVEFMLSPQGMFYKSRLVWAGDYADPENSGDNLYTMAHQAEDKLIVIQKKTECRFILNHTKMLFINKDTLGDIHPLSLLTCEGNGRGGGDYHGSDEALCGSWARDVISLESSDHGYTEYFHGFGK
jgi:hypothetical protein